MTRKRNECWRRHRALSAIPTTDAKEELDRITPQEELDLITPQEELDQITPQEELDRIKAQKNATLEILMERQGPPIRTYRGSEAEQAREREVYEQAARVDLLPQPPVEDSRYG